MKVNIKLNSGLRLKIVERKLNTRACEGCYFYEESGCIVNIKEEIDLSELCGASFIFKERKPKKEKKAIIKWSLVIEAWWDEYTFGDYTILEMKDVGINGYFKGNNLPSPYTFKSVKRAKKACIEHFENLLKEDK